MFLNLIFTLFILRIVLEIWRLIMNYGEDNKIDVDELTKDYIFEKGGEYIELKYSKDLKKVKLK